MALAPRSWAVPSVEFTPPVRVIRKAGPVAALLSPFRYRSNHARTRAWPRSLSMSPPSWPPAIQSTSTGAPFARIVFSAASDWARVNRESVWPCMNSVGTLIREPTADGERSRSISRAAGSGVPDSATLSYIRHSAGSKRVQPPPVLKKTPAHSFLKTPFGNRASARFQ